MQVTGNKAACAMVGYPEGHGTIFQNVANQLDTVILGRAVGSACTGLIDEGYALKGFRIDTKSCDWGPMRGFVCADPRLNKEGLGKEAFNTEYTGHALSGHVADHFTGHEEINPVHLQVEWVAGQMPLIISQNRIDALTEAKVITPQRAANGHLIGESSHGGARLRWRLIPMTQVEAGNARQITGNMVVASAYARGRKVDCEHYLLCVNSFASQPFQKYVGTIRPIYVIVGPHRFEVVQGLTNPGTEGMGFKGCVTGDYDLFGVWPKESQLGKHSRVSLHDLRSSPLLKKLKLPAVEKVSHDARPLDRAGAKKEHWQLGNISGRVNLVKVLLNTQLQSASGGGFAGGQCVHHSDEVGNPNPALQKSLDQSMPVIAFVPSFAGGGGAFGVDSVPDFYALAVRCLKAGYHTELRRNWQAGLDLAVAAADRLARVPAAPVV